MKTDGAWIPYSVGMFLIGVSVYHFFGFYATIFAIGIISIAGSLLL